MLVEREDIGDALANFHLEHTFELADAVDAHQIVEKTLISSKWKIQTASTSDVQAIRGSKAKLSLLGVSLIELDSLPMKILVTFHKAQDSKTRVQIQLSDSLGPSLTWGLKPKYKLALTQVLDTICICLGQPTIEADKQIPSPKNLDPKIPRPNVELDAIKSLATLHELHVEGVLAKNEFEAKKKDLLDRI